MSAPQDIYEAAFEELKVYGAELSRRDAAAIAIGLDHAWDEAVARVRAFVDAAVLQDGQDGTPPSDVLIPASELEALFAPETVREGTDHV